MIVLHSAEAEKRILGFLLSSFHKTNEKTGILSLIIDEHFIDTKNSYLYSHIREHQALDKIVLWERIKDDVNCEKLNITREYVFSLPEDTSVMEANSFYKILQDKLQKRKVYDFGRYIQDSIIKGKDQYKIALEAQRVLGNLHNDVQIDTNQELLKKVLSETRSDLISTGYSQLDSYLGGYTRGMIITIAGDSGHMKTTLALDKAFRMTERNRDLRIGIFSKEMLAEDLVKKQISRICKIPINKIFSGDYDKEYVKQKMSEVDVWENNRIRIINPNLFSGVSDIARIQMTHKFDIWFLDFIQMLEFSNKANTSSDYNVQVGQNMRNLQSLALGTKSVGIILSQVKKGIEHRTIKKPTVSDIEWSGLIKQLSTYIFFSYYPGKYYGFDKLSQDNYFLLGEKTRFAENFIYPLKVDPELGLFYEIQDIDKRNSILSKLKSVVK